jgi:hypothetical protein
MNQRRAQEEYRIRERNVPDNSNQQNNNKQYREREENRVREQPMVE